MGNDDKTIGEYKSAKGDENFPESLFLEADLLTRGLAKQGSDGNLYLTDKGMQRAWKVVDKLTPVEFLITILFFNETYEIGKKFRNFLENDDEKGGE